MVRAMWTMPANVLRLAAAGIGCCAAIGFIVGLNGAGPRPRLPGETLAAETAPQPKLNDEPISSEEIAPGVPEKEEEPPEEAPEPKAVAPVPTLPIPPMETAPPADKVGELLQSPPPPPEDEPPH
jgi:hypothetical protein